MGKIILKGVVKREPGYLYYVDKEGNVCRSRMRNVATAKAARKAAEQQRARQKEKEKRKEGEEEPKEPAKFTIP